MRQEYVEELEALKARMEQAEKFAEKLKLFSEYILKNKISESDYHINFGSSLKGKYLRWDVIRSLLSADQITNYRGSFEDKKPLFKVYINTCSLFDNHEKFEIEKYITSDLYFFYDELNSTYYVSDESMEEFSNKLAEWLDQAYAHLEEYNKKKQIAELESKLSKLEEIL